MATREDFDRWARLVSHGDELAAREFADWAGPALRAFFHNRGMSWDAAEELAVTCVTDVVLKVQEGGFGGGRFDSWIFALAKNRQIDLIRREERRKAWHQGWEDMRKAAVLPVATDIADAVHNALRTLSETDQAILAARYNGDESFSEIGKRLGLSAGNARIRHHRALKVLARLLSKNHTITNWLR